jgi:hypothetical protein
MWGRSSSLSANKISVLSSTARIFPVFVAIIIAFFYVFNSFLFKCIKNLKRFKKEMFESGHFFVIFGLEVNCECSLNGL